MDATTQANIRDYLTLARDDLDTARQLLSTGRYRQAVSRAYYAIFYAASAVLLSQGLQRARHSGVQSAFGQFFVKPGLIEAEYNDIYQIARELREASDYELHVALATEAVEQLVADAERFVARMEGYLRGIGAVG